MEKESLHRIVNKLCNELIDLKKQNGGGSSITRKNFKFKSKKYKRTPTVKKMTYFSLEGTNMEYIVQSLQH
jgi:hypothetical protein